MTEDNINYQYITQYIRTMLPKTSGLLQEMEQYAEEYHIPIVHPEVAKLICIIGRLAHPARILEIGTAIGYSAILLSNILQPGGVIHTIEKNPDMANKARENITASGLDHCINIFEGDAIEILPTLEGTYDYIFIDASKGHYEEFLSHCIRLLEQGGVLISDNVLYKGMIASDKLVIRRKKTIVKRMRNYLKIIACHPLLETSIIPIGDGLAVSYRNEGDIDE